MATEKTSSTTEGAVCILAGIAAILVPYIFTIGLPILIGLCFIVAGAVWIWRGWRQAGSTRSTFSLILAAVMVIGGIVLLIDPELGTLAIGILLLAQGLVVLAVALTQRRDTGIGFLVTIGAGIAGTAFGLAILFFHPFAQAWVLPLMVAVDLILLGLSLILGRPPAKA